MSIESLGGLSALFTRKLLDEQRGFGLQVEWTNLLGKPTDGAAVESKQYHDIARGENVVVHLLVFAW